MKQQALIASAAILAIATVGVAVAIAGCATALVAAVTALDGQRRR